MKTFKNGIELMLITLQQFSSSNDILTFQFEKPKNFNLQGSLVQIIYEIDKLDNIRNNNITIEEKENCIFVNWLVKESITLTSGIKKIQIVIRNNKNIYLSNVFEIKVLESLNIDNKIVETNLSYLEYWEERINELIVKIEDFEQVDFTEFITKSNFDEISKNYFTKLELQQKLDEKVDNSKLENLATKYELESKLNIDTYNIEKNEFQLKTSNSLNTENKNIVDAINELKINIDNNYNIDLSNYYNKTEITEKLNLKLDKSFYNTDNSRFQLRSDRDLQTDNKTVTGAINELKNQILGYFIPSMYSYEIYYTSYSLNSDDIVEIMKPDFQSTSYEIIYLDSDIYEIQNLKVHMGGSPYRDFVFQKISGVNHPLNNKLNAYQLKYLGERSISTLPKTFRAIFGIYNKKNNILEGYHCITFQQLN